MTTGPAITPPRVGTARDRAFAVREAGPDDADALSTFLTEAFIAAYGTISPPEDTEAFVRESYAPASLRESLRDPGLRTWVAHDGDEWAGCAQLVLRVEEQPASVPERPSGELRRFYLRPAWFGSPVAPTLMRRLQDTAIAHELRAVWCYVWQHAPQAIRFYEKHGFVVVDDSPTFAVGKTLHDDYIMAWRPPA